MLNGINGIQGVQGGNLYTHNPCTEKTPKWGASTPFLCDLEQHNPREMHEKGKTREVYTWHVSWKPYGSARPITSDGGPYRERNNAVRTMLIAMAHMETAKGFVMASELRSHIAPIAQMVNEDFDTKGGA